MQTVRFWMGPALAFLFLASACGDDDANDGPTPSGGAGGAGGTGGVPSTGGTATGGTGGATGGTGGATGGTGGCAPNDMYTPSPADVQFSAVSALPSGSQLLFNNWDASPQTVTRIDPDGSNAAVVFEAYGIWSLGAKDDGSTLAFASGDPNQDQNFCINIFNAIQHTFAYDTATQSASLLAAGNINDECHTFSDVDDRLYVCRRYNFTTDGMFDGYRIGYTDLNTNAFEWVTPEDNLFYLHPSPTNDGSELYYTEIEIMGASQQRRIMKKALPNGTPELVRDNASGPVLSPDGTRYLYSDTADGGKLKSSLLDGTGVILIADKSTTKPTYSPDGSQVAYLDNDSAANCSHIEVVNANGTPTASPRIRDCAQSGEFITDLEWVEVQ